MIALFGSRDGCISLPTSKMKQFLSLLDGFAFISKEHISEHLQMTASEK